LTRTILILGTNAGQADLIRHMKARGWRVIGCSALAGEPGEAFCDLFEQVDVVDLDALEAVARRHRVDLVYSISSDVAIRSAVALSERMGLPHFHDSALVAMLDDKAAMRAFLALHDLGAVPFAMLHAAEDAVGWARFPCIVKPVDAQGQRGVEKIERARDLAEAAERARAESRSGRAIVEEFLDGVELSCNLLICDGETRLKVLSERLVHQGPAIGVPVGHLVPPVSVDVAAQDAALALVGRIITAMGMPDGPLYIQMIVTPDGPRVVEIAPRLDGCHMWRLIHAARGADLIGMTVDCLTGDAPVATLSDCGQGTRQGEHPWELMFQQAAPGTVFDPQDHPAPPDTVFHEYRYARGEPVRAVNGVLEVVGYFVRASA